MIERIILYYDKCRNSILELFRKAIFKRFSPNKTYSKVLIIRKGTIGDHTVCQPIYIALRSYFQDAQLHLLTSNGGNEYAHISKLPEHTLFDSSINADDMGKRMLIQTLKQENYQLVIELPQDLDTLYTQIRNMIVFKYCGISTGIGWAPGISFLFKSCRYKNIKLIREFEKHKENLHSQGFAISIEESYLEAEPVELLENINFNSLVVIAPGAKLPCKRWPHYQELSAEMSKYNHQIVLIGADGEGFEGENILNLCGKLSILQSRYLISKSKLVICNDSGPMHLAYSVGTSLVALFGARSYPKAWWPPSNNRFKVIVQLKDHPLAYITQTKWEQREDLHLNSISVNQVVDSALKQLL